MGEESTKEVKDIVEEEKQEIILIDEEVLRSKIYEIRGQKVMLDFELAEIYGYTTTRFNEQVKNNIEKFDGDFMFELTKEEFENLMSKKSISSWGGRRKLPKVFTEQGVYMLMTVLRGKHATMQSKALIRTFKKMKDYIIDNQNLIGQTGTFTPVMNTEAWLNITYNYSRYYYECYEEGIEKIYGMSGVESIPVLEDMISLLMNKYQNNGVWLKSKRTKTVHYDELGKAVDYLEVITGRKKSCRKENIEYEVDEGDTGNYWTPTAANAIRPLYKLIALARMRPDCIWDGD